MLARPWLRNRISIDHMVEESERHKTSVTAAAFEPATEYAHATRDIDSIRLLSDEYPVLNGVSWAPAESANWPAMPVFQRIPRTT